MKLSVRTISPVALSLFFALAFPAQAQTLREAVEQAIKSNPDVLTEVNERRAREQEIKQAESDYYPKVDFVAGYGQDKTDTATTRADNDDDWKTRRELGFNIEQNLFLGYGTKNEVERQEARVKSTAYTIQGNTEKTALDAIDAYLEVLRRQERIVVLKEDVAAHQRIFDQIKLRSESGIGRRADMDQIRGRLASTEANLIAERINLKDAETFFFRVVDHPPENLQEPVSFAQFLPASMDEAVERAVKNHPTLKSANADIEAAQAQNRAAKHPFYPRLDIEAQYATDWRHTENKEMEVMLRLRYNFFNGGFDKARRKQTLHLLNEAAEVRNDTHRQVVESIRLSWTAYQAAMEQLEYKKQHYLSTDETREIYKKQFNIGQRTLLDVLDTETEYVEAKLDYIDTKYLGKFAEFRILRGMGELMPDLSIAFPEEALVDESKPSTQSTSDAESNEEESSEEEASSTSTNEAETNEPEAAVTAPAATIASPALAEEIPSASAPEPAPVPDLKTKVRSTINSWIASWSGQDIEAYLNHYAADFNPPHNISRSIWEEQRSQRIQRPAYINIEISEMEISLHTDGTARARFLQDYSSPSYSDRVKKTLTLKPVDGSWKISEELATAI